MLGTFVGLVLCAACVGLGISEFRRTGMLLTPWTIFLALSVVDVFLPGTLFSAFGMGVQAPWITGTVAEFVPRAMVFFAAAVVLFGVSYSLIDEMPSTDSGEWTGF